MNSNLTLKVDVDFGDGWERVQAASDEMRVILKNESKRAADGDGLLAMAATAAIAAGTTRKVSRRQLLGLVMARL